MFVIKTKWSSGILLHACVIAGLWVVPAAVQAGVYGVAAEKGATWLISQRYVTDGSWGATDDVKFIQTSEAVMALAALNKLNYAYYAGVSWLDNHPPSNVDFISRRVLTLGPAGGSVSLDTQALQGAQNLVDFGNNGWGLSGYYQGGALDTGLSLQALNQQGISANVAQAVAYLTGAQLSGTDKGWGLGQEVVSDPITTAQVLQALIPLSAVNAAVPVAITNGLAALNAKVGASSPVPQIALAALANLRNSAASAAAVPLLNALVAQQAADGSWGTDPYATALALRALAAGDGKDLAAQKLAVSVVDTNLRAALNSALGNGALDSISRGQLAQLTSLDISGKGIQNLTGLEWAVNLTSLSAANNNISSVTPLAGLKLLTQVNLSGNPATLQATTVTLVPSSNPVQKTVAISLTATVLGTRPIGTVTFYDGLDVIGMVTLDANSSQVTSASSVFVLSNKLIAGGFRQLTASYSGDAGNMKSSSKALVEIVNPDASAILSAILAAQK